MADRFLKFLTKEIIELIVCRCKTGCAKLTCSCRKNKMCCTAACSCIDCTNDDLTNNDSDADDTDIKNID